MPMKKSGLFRNKNAKATPYKNKGVTEVGKEAKTQSYKEYVQKMFGGGMSGNRGFLTQSSMSQPDPVLPRGKVGRGPGMKAGGKTKEMGMGGMFRSGPTKPKNPSTPGSWGDKINKIRNRNPDPILPRGKKGKGDI